ncbi:hypothetical protein scyTo_0012845 [Scyliorhinus torazame]|uniref:Uncharacterized protein n=1 Tax=Scyliorhinus torazame TaxID=75743 RepID=A0A401NJK2_SCYTO|nr:hypothetical protein [Scyliorhinus torazame]
MCEMSMRNQEMFCSLSRAHNWVEWNAPAPEQCRSLYLYRAFVHWDISESVGERNGQNKKVTNQIIFSRIK